MDSAPELIFWTIGYITHPFFNHFLVLQMLIVYSTFQINIFGGILVFQLGIFIIVKTLPRTYVLVER